MAKKQAKARRGKARARSAKRTRSAKTSRTRRAALPAARKSRKKSGKKKTTAKRRAPKPSRLARRSAPRAKAPRNATRAKATKKKLGQTPPARPKTARANKTTRRAPRTISAPAAKKPVPTPRLERVRRRLPDVERAGEERRDERMLAAARTGHDELVEKLSNYTATSPALTAGDVDAKWEDAYAIGDEAPGGDNPTPDQDRVDDIGKALGVQYQDNEELQGGDEILERDEKRWELDPASSDDWPHDKKDED